MNRIDRCFAHLAEEKKKALIIYLTAHDPDEQTSVDAAMACVEAGADILEIGVPFSDPLADGEAIQAAMLRALNMGGGLLGALRVVKKIRALTDVPIVLFGYLNPLLSGGFETTIARVKESGADGVLVVDAPLEECAPYKKKAEEHGLAWVSLVAPTSGPLRSRTISKNASGFLYLVSMTGVTGKALDSMEGVESMISWLGEGDRLPACVGFGIRDAQSARAAAAKCEGAVVGSEAIRKLHAGLESGQGVVALKNFVAELRHGLDGL